jgi:hypothetical protein
MSAEVFISYSSKDRNHAVKVCTALEKEYQISCWIAPRNIPGGSTWANVVEGAISTAKFLVLILSKNSEASDEVGKELEIAKGNNKTMIPARIEKIGSKHDFINDFQYVDLFETDGIARLARDILKKFKRNSLGMRFVEVNGVHWSLWQTRVKDFRTFVDASTHDETTECRSIDEDGWQRAGKNWKDPGFHQTDEHPVCGVSWEDATAFCEWLTQKEKADGLIEETEVYRLPTDVEWSEMAGKDLYPWGDSFENAKEQGRYFCKWDEGTAPVGSFKHSSGLYDVGGNVWEWCQDAYRKKMNRQELRKKEPRLDCENEGAYRVMRGGSWIDYDEAYMETDFRCFDEPAERSVVYGFRCVRAKDGA